MYCATRDSASIVNGKKREFYGDGEKDAKRKRDEALALEATKKIGQLEGQEEIQQVVDAFTLDVLNILKDASIANNEKQASNTYTQITGCYNIPKSQKDIFNAQTATLHQGIDVNINNAQNIEEVNNANLEGNKDYSGLSDQIADAEENGS